MYGEGDRYLYTLVPRVVHVAPAREGREGEAAGGRRGPREGLTTVGMYIDSLLYNMMKAWAFDTSRVIPTREPT